jgi:Rad3-related DNA helicase
MAFKDIPDNNSNYESIGALFADIRANKKIDSLYAHQAEILKAYETEFIKSPNVAIELPTGTGKTLIGILIAEYHRIVNRKKVVYICSTNQLVNQVVLNSNEKYGIKATPFTGSKDSYNHLSVAAYRTLDTIAITNYSSIFNVNPFFSDADLLILDDAHVAENYVAYNWSLNLDRDGDFYIDLLEIFASSLEYNEYARLKADASEGDYTIQLIPTQTIYKHKNQLFDYFNSNLDSSSDLFYKWLNIRDHLTACQIFISYNSILIRPIIPPTLEIAAFKNPGQRIYMSATLGSGGDLERMMGVKKIDKIPLPAGWDRRGQGQRFFIFPELSLDEKGVKQFFIEINKVFKRSLSLVSSNQKANDLREILKNELNFEVFDARAIEKSKAEFTSKESAAVVVANRYEGIDFEGDECRLLFVMDLPKTINNQEGFILQRLGSQIVIQDRIRTRIVQAIGRCTRGFSDYSCVVVQGKDILEQLTSIKFQQYFHPELQAEILFGIQQSKETALNDLIDNVKVFADQGTPWKSAQTIIYKQRDKSHQEAIPGTAELSACVTYEVEFQYFMWHENYKEAVNAAQSVINKLSGGPELKGYRAFWNYLASVASFLAANEYKSKEYYQKAGSFLEAAAGCSPSITWMRKLSHKDLSEINEVSWNQNLALNAERLDATFEKLGVAITTKFEGELAETLRLLSSNKANDFEFGHRRLGILLGFNSDKDKEQGAPDCYWITGDLCIVFEDHSDSQNGVIPIIKARQSSDHSSWIKSKFGNNLIIYPVIISGATKIDAQAIPYTDGVYYVSLEAFRDWAAKAIQIIRKVRQNYASGNINWREAVMTDFMDGKIDPQSIVEFLTTVFLRDLPQG